MPHNDPELADAVLAASGHTGDATLRSALIERLDITTLTGKQVEDLRGMTGTDAPPADWAAGRQIDRSAGAAPGTLSAEQLTALLRPLPPRYYSIASSRKAVGEEAHLLVAGAAVCVAWARRVPASPRWTSPSGIAPGRTAEGVPAAESAFPAARGSGPAGHHGRTRHRCGAVPRLPAGTRGDRRRRPQLAGVRASQLHA